MFQMFARFQTVQAYNIKVQPKRIAIMTMSPDRTLGDASSTIKLIKSIANARTAYWDPIITWILCIDNIQDNYMLYEDFIDVAESFGVKVQAINMQYGNNTPRIQAIKDINPIPDQLIFFSSFGPLWCEQDLANSLGIMTLRAAEYDSIECYGADVIPIGLGTKRICDN
jgi:hypothetical protein